MNDLVNALLYSRDRFAAFGPSHLAVIASSILAACLLVGHARRRPDSLLHRWLPRVLGLTIVVSEITFALFPVYLGTFRVDWALPLQLCDLTAFTTGFGLIAMNALALEAAFFLGLSATLLTRLTPDLLHDFPHIEFFCFFLTHALVSVAALYAVFGLDQRPRPLALPGSQSDVHVNYALPDGWLVQVGTSMGERTARSRLRPASSWR